MPLASFKLGYDILTAVDGREAVEVVAHAMMHGRTIDAILMDVNMPDVDGLQATQQIQAAWAGRAPPVIALSPSRGAGAYFDNAIVPGAVYDLLGRSYRIGARLRF